ncbi:MAG: hypothetical protein WA374_21105 [Acidobacteriaceae bacterium]
MSKYYAEMAENLTAILFDDGTGLLRARELFAEYVEKCHDLYEEVQWLKGENERLLRMIN